MMSKRVLVVLGHPSGESFCAALTESYVEAARTSGHKIVGVYRSVNTKCCVEQQALAGRGFHDLNPSPRWLSHQPNPVS